MIKIYNEPIPDGKLTYFKDILGKCGGRFTRNPVEVNNDKYGRYRVDYEYDDSDSYSKHQRLWLRATRDIKEIDKSKWYHALLRRFGFIN